MAPTRDQFPGYILSQPDGCSSGNCPGNLHFENLQTLPNDGISSYLVSAPASPFKQSSEGDYSSSYGNHESHSGVINELTWITEPLSQEVMNDIPRQDTSQVASENRNGILDELEGIMEAMNAARQSTGQEVGLHSFFDERYSTSFHGSVETHTTASSSPVGNSQHFLPYFPFPWTASEWGNSDVPLANAQDEMDVIMSDSDVQSTHEFEAGENNENEQFSMSDGDSVPAYEPQDFFNITAESQLQIGRLPPLEVRTRDELWNSTAANISLGDGPENGQVDDETMREAIAAMENIAQYGRADGPAPQGQDEESWHAGDGLESFKFSIHTNRDTQFTIDPSPTAATKPQAAGTNENAKVSDFSQSLPRFASEPDIRVQDEDEESFGAVPERVGSYRTAREVERDNRREEARTKFRVWMGTKPKEKENDLMEDIIEEEKRGTSFYEYDRSGKRWVAKLRDGLKKVNQRFAIFMQGRRRVFNKSERGNWNSRAGKNVPRV